MSGFRGIFGVALLALAASCGSEVIADVDGWADRGCACKTTECALEVREEFTAWVEKERGVRGSRTEKAKIEKAAKRLFKCLDAMKAADPPPAVPKPPTDAATDKPTTDKPTTDKPTTDKPATDSPKTEKAAPAKPKTEKAAPAKPKTEKAAPAKPATDEAKGQ